MTIYCYICKKAPNTYIVVNGYSLCMKCADIQYEFELDRLKFKYGK